MTPFWRRTLILVLLASLAFSSVQNVQGENPRQTNNVASAPRVISSTPAQREVVGTDVPITLFFDQSMDRASVEQALTIDPKVDGAFSWADDMTLTYKPNTSLQRGQAYQIIIGTAAKAKSGVPLDEAFKLTFNVTGNLTVGQVVPAPDAQQVEARATITVVFSRPVVPLINSADQASLPQPLTLSPAVEGKGEWVGTAIYVFRPTKPLAGGTTYTATVSADVKDVDGTPLEAAYGWKFTTIAPQLLDANPYADQQLVPVDQTISFNFNQPMDEASIKEAFALRNTANGATVAGTLRTENEGATFYFTPASRLEFGTRYQLTITGTAKSASGNASLTNALTTTFTTVPLPAIISSFPPNGGKIEPGQGVSIQFNAPMDAQSFAGKVHVEPKPDDLSINPSYNQLYIGFRSLPGTTYNVTIDAGIADPYGNTIKEPYKLTFSTLDAAPTLGLASQNTIAVTSTYRPQTTIPAAGINVKQLDVKLSALELPEFFSVMRNGYFDLYNYAPPRISREWSQPLDAKLNERIDLPLALSTDNSGKLAPGVYFLQVTSPEFTAVGDQSFRQMVVVATAALTFKLGPEEALIWATDLKTGQALNGVKIDVYNADNQIAASGTTDANGLFRTNAVKYNQNDQYRPYMAVASGDGVFSMVSSQWSQEFQPYQYGVQQDFSPRKAVGYLYTDQPVYRPGHPVLFRGIIREQNDVNFEVPGTQPIQVIIGDSQGKDVFKQTFTLNNYGAFSGRYDPPSDAALGGYTIQVRYAQTNFFMNFQVSEFRPPEFLVNTKAADSQLVAGDTIKVDVDSTFFFGGPVSNAQVSWVAVANTGFFNYTGDGNYDFSAGRYYYDEYVYNRQVATGSGKLDDKGHLTIELPADLAGSSSPQNFTIEATVTDVSNQAISGRTNVMVHPAKVYIGLQPAKYVGQADEPLDVNVIAVDWASVPQPSQSITLKVAEKRWQQDPATLQWKQESIAVTDGTVTTDDKGKAKYTFTPPRAGIYEIEATTRDPQERIAKTTTNVWVSGPNYISWDRDQKGVTMVLDKKQYAPGDTASVLIPSPFPEPVQALVTVERAGIMTTDLITITGSYTYKLPLEVIHAPNVYIAVAIMRGSGDKTDVVPEMRYGIINIPVTPPQQIKVTLTPSTKSAKPGDTVKFDVLTTDLTGEPVAAEVGLSLSDLANLSVGTDQSAKIFDFFWSPRPLSITTSTTVSLLIDALTSKDVRLMQARRRQTAFNAEGTPLPTATMGQSEGLAQSGGAGGDMAANEAAPAPAADGLMDAAAKSDRDESKNGAPPTPRTNFVDTPLWVPDLVTGVDGKGSASVTLPDNLTTWRLNARAASLKTYVGDATIDIVSTKPLLVRPSTPRFFVVGDQAELAVVVNNNSDQNLSVDVTLDAKGVTLKADGKQTVSIPKAGRTRITWLAEVGEVENVDLTFTAISGEFSDASKPAVGLGDQRLLPVYRYEAPDYVSTAGVLREPGTRTEAVIVPNATLAPSGELTIKVQPSLAATTIDSLKYLRNYPYQCVEQTVSRFLPNVITYRALQKLQLDKPELRTELEVAVKFALARLQREQHPDGGWGWFPNDHSNPLTSTYALLGLIEAKASDFPVDEDMFQRATAYVLSTVQQVDDNTERWVMNRLSFTLYVLARAQSPNISVMDALFQRREKTHLFARAFLAQGYFNANGDRAKIDTLISDIQTRAVVSATGTHWEEDHIDWWNWDSNTRTTAIILKTLVDINPQSELLPNVVRWMMVARKGDAWETTQETAWGVMALTSWMDASGELKADYGYTVNLNGKSVGDGNANADTLRDTNTLVVNVQDMLREQVNRVSFDHSDGPGSLYYTATLHVQQPVELIKATNRGIALSRTYYIANKAVTGAKVGETITVALEITADSDLYYVNINDPIPAGTELVDQSLQTTSQVGQRPELTLIDPYYGGWGWWYFSNMEPRTEKMVLSATYLPKGTYRFVYQIRASSPGVYKVIPANGNQFYFPEVFGRGEGSLFTITP